MHYIYKITNLINNKIYIGQTNNPSLRWSQHKSNAKYNRGQQIITRAITKYGVDNFEFEVIASCKDQKDVDVTEEEIINQYNSQDLSIGYNLDRGGNTCPRTPEIAEKISNALKEYYETHDGWLKGKTLTEEWKENISKSSVGKSGTNKGKNFNDEWKNNISVSQAGREQKYKRRFTEDVEKEICRLYAEENKSAYAIGKQFNCQGTTITDILNRLSIQIRKSNYNKHSNNCNLFTDKQEKEICNKYINGFVSRSELSRQYNCGKTTIRDILIRHDIKISRS